MKVIIPGHRYLLGPAGGFQQTLAFIMKTPQKDVPASVYALETVQDGTTTEEVLKVLIDRTNHLNKAVPCRENSLAVTKMEEALLWLNERTRKRVETGVEGTMKA